MHYEKKCELLDSSDGNTALLIEHTVCSNSDCRKAVLAVKLMRATHLQGRNIHGAIVSNNRVELPIGSWKLRPESQAKPQPDYIPQPLRQDYLEACLISDLSPKASATLSRRCLQGMIRDFHKISRGTLGQEINELKGKIDQGIWDAIDAVRKVGNIGAHMEKDINVIVDVDPKEAQLLIELIEQLFQDWYVVRFERELRIASVKALAEMKDAAKNVLPQQEDPTPS